MENAVIKNIVTKKPNTWTKPEGNFPEIIRADDGTIVTAEYVELPTGELMIIEYEINPNDEELARKVQAFIDSENGNTQGIALPAKEAAKPVILLPYVKKAPPQSTRDIGKTTSANSAGKNGTRIHKKSSNSLSIIVVIAAMIIIGLTCSIIIPKLTKNISKNPDNSGTTTEHSETASDTKTDNTTDAADNTNSSDDTGITDSTVISDITDGTDGTDTAPEAIEESLAIYTMAGTVPYHTDDDETDDDNYEIEFNPHCVESTAPSNLIASSSVCVDGTTLDSVSDYVPNEEITFDLGKKYTDIEGVITFRGNNFRNEPTYGYTDMSTFTMEGVWTKQTGSLAYNEESWSGSGWTGQPLIIKWPKATKANMNMFDWAKEDDDLVEVIYACMDGYIYFLDLETGEKTRDAMYLGFTFKGSGALDPRGYPIMYVGAGYDSTQGSARVFVINLLDCSVMYTFGNEDPFSLRGSLSYFDSSALVDAETDTLIYPGENGVLYLIKLGTEYDEEKGTLSINPEHIVKWHYNGIRTSSAAFWPGMEDSAVTYKGYLFIQDNGGNFLCLNLNTMEIVWVQDCLDDSNSTPVLSIEDGKAYLYASTSFHIGWRSSSSATIPIWKIDAETGEIIWQTEYQCESEAGVSGGVQSTIAVGRDELSDYIYVTVSRTGGLYNGVLSCISKVDGTVMWEHKASYAWSSPVCVYNEDGTGKVIYCSSNGKMYLLDGKTGETYDTIVLSDGCIEASPAVYNNMVVVGTRACKIWGVRLN